MQANQPTLLILGAHPDDAEFHAGGLAARYREMGREVKLISVTDGGAGHHQRSREELVVMRKEEAAEAGSVIGAKYEVWNFPDGELQPTLDVRRRIIREIREFAPDLVLTHRPCDYHPDHRAVGNAVRDASYMVTVPLMSPGIRALKQDPVVAYFPDFFTKPYPMQADVLIDVSDQVDRIARMLSCQQSQVFEWLPYEEGVLDQVPNEESDRLAWVRAWYAKHARPRAEWYRADLETAFGKSRGREIEFVEFFEISEYARQPDQAMLRRLFPDSVQR